MPLNENDVVTLTRKDFATMLSLNEKVIIIPSKIEPSTRSRMSMCNEIAKRVIDVYSDLISSGSSVSLTNIGNLVSLQKNERVGRNPKTGKEHQIKSMRTVSLRKRSPDGLKIGKAQILLNLKSALSDCPRINCSAINDTFLSFVSRASSGEERIELRGFGVFYPAFRDARVRRNPKTGETLHKEAGVRLSFRLSTSLLMRLNPDLKKSRKKSQ
jgi:integration host factor subunit beta